MPNITITFSFPINVSVQVGDTAYYTSNTTPLGTHIHSDQNEIIQIGNIVSINRITNTIVCDWDPSPATALYPNSDDFIMFSKDNKVNLSSLLGYYSLIKLRNDSKTKAEIFSIGADFIESSK
tara:strand:+ start:426 stop:794 length:369 start_codon:yes stop_codon:yes gene_type:complete